MPLAAPSTAAANAVDPDLAGVPVRWVFHGLDAAGKLTSRLSDDWAPPSSILDVNAYAKTALAIRSKRWYIKPPEILGFPAEYALLAADEVAGLLPLDTKLYHEVFPPVANDMGCCKLYGLSSVGDSLFCHLPGSFLAEM